MRLARSAGPTLFPELVFLYHLFVSYAAHLQVLSSLVVFAASSCGTSSQPNANAMGGHAAERNVVPASAAVADSVFQYARASITAHAVPERFFAAIPTSLDEFRGDWARHPPRSWISWALCEGDMSMHRRVLRAIETAAGRGEMDPDLKDGYVALHAYCSDKAKCDAVAETLKQAQNAQTHDILVTALGYCRSSEYRALVDGSLAGPSVLVDWYYHLSGEAIASSERIRRAAEEVALAGAVDEVHKVGVILGGMSDPEALATLIRIHERLEDPWLRAVLVIRLRDHPRPEARALYRESCNHPDLGSRSLCSDSPPRIRPARDNHADSDLERTIRGYKFDAGEFLAQSPERRAELLAALARCAQQPMAIGKTLYEHTRCLRELIVLDRAAAVAAVSSAGRAPSDDWYFEDMANVLLAYPEPGALEQALRTWGLIGDEPAHPDEDRDRLITADQLMFYYRRVHMFDVETGIFPHEHDSLLRDLAKLVTPALDNVVFEEITPMSDGMPYVLRAYMDGKRYEFLARDDGVGYDLGQVIGMINTLLHTRASPWRLVSLATVGQIALVAAGPGSGLLAARARGLLRFGDPHRARKAGRAFEDRLFEALE